MSVGKLTCNPRLDRTAHHITHGKLSIDPVRGQKIPKTNVIHKGIIFVLRHHLDTEMVLKELSISFIHYRRRNCRMCLCFFLLAFGFSESEATLIVAQYLRHPTATGSPSASKCSLCSDMNRRFCNAN